MRKILLACSIFLLPLSTRLRKSEDAPDWFADSAQGVHEIRELIEFKTTWHPIGA